MAWRQRHEWLPCELYQAWESARDDADLALADWRAAPHGSKAEAFTAFRSATEREDAAASAWLRTAAEYDDRRAA